MKNTIQFDGKRTSVSSSGNTEWFDFTVTSTQEISKSAARGIGQAHGMGGQEFSCEYRQDGDLHIYVCNAKCYCD